LADPARDQVHEDMRVDDFFECLLNEFSVHLYEPVSLSGVIPANTLFAVRP
jgi:hypothetical protein